MNDQLAKGVRLLALAIVIHAVVYFVSNFQPYQLYPANPKEPYGFVRLNKITGGTKNVALKLSYVARQTEKTEKYDFGDILTP